MHDESGDAMRKGRGSLLEPWDQWQAIFFEGDLIAPPRYDSARGGLFAFLIVKAPAGCLKTDSIEIGA